MHCTFPHTRSNKLTHNGREAEGEAQSQGHLTGHAAPGLRFAEEDDGAEEGHHQREEQGETQQSIIGLHQRGADVSNKHHLEKKQRESQRLRVRAAYSLQQGSCRLHRVFFSSS